MENRKTDRFLAAARGMLAALFPSHSISEPVRHETSYRFILTKPPNSKVLAITDTLLAVASDDHDNVQRLLLERHVREALEAANNTDVVYLTADGLETRRE